MNIDMLIDGILDSYERYGLINRSTAENFPNRQNVVLVLQDLQSLVFPGFRVAEDLDSTNIRYATGQRVNNIIAKLTREIEKALIYTNSQSEKPRENFQNSGCFKLAEKVSVSLIEEIPEIRRKILSDTQALCKGDPAAKSNEEVILSYPGLEAILVYRIGETCIIGNNVKIYQGVTLGALSVKKTLQNKKRHPTIEDDVTIYANATILGGETVIGRGSIIGGNTWITESVPENSIVTQR